MRRKYNENIKLRLLGILAPLLTIDWQAASDCPKKAGRCPAAVPCVPLEPSATGWTLEVVPEGASGGGL